MGLNAQTTVPAFTAGQVLTAAQVTQINTGIPVFATTTTRDAAFGTGKKTLAQGQFCYLESTGKLQVYSGSSWLNVGTQTNVATFTASGTWTVPAGVTYAVATIIGGGGGAGAASSGTGGTSSVAFASGTISAIGGTLQNGATNGTPINMVAGVANSGQGATGLNIWDGGSGIRQLFIYQSRDGARITAGAAVTAGASITVTVGNGGAAGTSGAAGGSGYVFITYEV